MKNQLLKTKVLICGGRNFKDWDLFYKTTNHLEPERHILISGCAKGVDTMVIVKALDEGFELMKFPANWDKYGKRAGFIRNYEMGKVADELIALPGRIGTKHMIETFKKLHPLGKIYTIE